MAFRRIALDRHGRDERPVVALGQHVPGAPNPLPGPLAFGLHEHPAPVLAELQQSQDPMRGPGEGRQRRQPPAVPQPGHHRQPPVHRLRLGRGADPDLLDPGIAAGIRSGSGTSTRLKRRFRSGSIPGGATVRRSDSPRPTASALRPSRQTATGAPA
jgi:hypothetical protein